MRYRSEAFILPCRARGLGARRGRAIGAQCPRRGASLCLHAYLPAPPRTKAPTRAKKNGRWLERPKLPKEEDENMEPDVLSMLS